MPDLSRLTKVSLREVWADEAADFTPWLAENENIKLLANSLGLELEVEEQEKQIGPFRADILCKNSLDGNWVLIENQIAKTDHIHLGQLMTYAAGLDAVTIIWIAEKFTDEHRAALDWLNDITGDKFTFFGIEVELWRIDDSAIAPKFNIVSKPNDWSRTIKSATGGGKQLTEHQQLQLKYWTEFKIYMESHGSMRCQKPQSQHWMDHSIGRGGFSLKAIISLWSSVTEKYDPEIRVDLVINSLKPDEHFVSLKSKKEQIEDKIDLPITWHNPEGVRSRRIYVRTDANILDSSLWPDQFDWLKTYLEKFRDVFGPLVKNLPN